MSVRDRIANLNSSKAPIITASGSGDNSRTNSKNASATQSGETAVSRESAADSSEQQTSKPSTIAERIARLKQSDVGKEGADPHPLSSPGAVGSISSKIALLGANVKLGERPPGAMYSNPNSNLASIIGSRMNTASSSGSDNHGDSGVISKGNSSGDSTSLVHVSCSELNASFCQVDYLIKKLLPCNRYSANHGETW